MTTTEERLSGALADRAAAAGTALSILVAVAAAAALRPAADVAAPVSPIPSTSASPSTGNYPKDRAIAGFGDRRLVEIDTRTGAEVRTITRLDSPATRYAWSPDRRSIAFSDRGCTLFRVDVATGTRTSLGPGYAPAFSPDSARLAAARCDEGGVDVVDLATGARTTYRNQALPGAFPTDPLALAKASDIAWYDSGRLVVTRHWEGAEETVLLDLAADRTIGDAEPIGIGATRVAVASGAVFALRNDSGVEDTKPTEFLRLGRLGEAPEVLFTHPGLVLEFDVDRNGALLFAQGDGLWRWDGSGAPRLVVRGVAAVAT